MVNILYRMPCLQQGRIWSMLKKILLKYKVMVIVSRVGLTIITIEFPVLNKNILCINSYSSLIAVLTIFVWVFVIDSYYKIVNNPNLVYISILTAIIFRCVIFFIARNILLLFILFETRLVIILIFILGWGYQIERIQASVYLLFYTLFASFPLILIFIYMTNTNKSLILFNQSQIYHPSPVMFMFLIIAFIVKFPVYFFHLWLPKAHVEASTSGSIILAGVLLKIGRYGLYRILQIFPVYYIRRIIVSFIGLTAVVLRGFMCILQRDMKSLVAYSSVNHITLMFLAIIISYSAGITGRMLLMVSHGFVSSILFWISGLLFRLMSTRIIFFYTRVPISFTYNLQLNIYCFMYKFFCPPFYKSI